MGADIENRQFGGNVLPDKSNGVQHIPALHVKADINPRQDAHFSQLSCQPVPETRELVPTQFGTRIVIFRSGCEYFDCQGLIISTLPLILVSSVKSMLSLSRHGADNGCMKMTQAGSSQRTQVGRLITAGGEKPITRWATLRAQSIDTLAQNADQRFG